MKIEKDYDINLSRQLIRVKLQVLNRHHNKVFYLIVPVITGCLGMNKGDGTTTAYASTVFKDFFVRCDLLSAFMGLKKMFFFFFPLFWQTVTYKGAATSYL
ncbi:MAG: hypothetical protein MI862_24915 [Desulfobacterales bacterium]|nr:hypothetical protein [Desulfobacterales bacterium]